MIVCCYQLSQEVHRQDFEPNWLALFKANFMLLVGGIASFPLKIQVRTFFKVKIYDYHFPFF